MQYIKLGLVKLGQSNVFALITNADMILISAFTVDQKSYITITIIKKCKQDYLKIILSLRNTRYNFLAFDQQYFTNLSCILSFTLFCLAAVVVTHNIKY